VAAEFNFIGGVIINAKADVVDFAAVGIFGALVSPAPKRRSPTNDFLLVHQQFLRSADQRLSLAILLVSQFDLIGCGM
jgi:hypothetical protein